ncbi:MAG TPA: hypothetical protein PKW95_04745 [bacterium]|nr:hypothetical protein [bacterium]
MRKRSVLLILVLSLLCFFVAACTADDDDDDHDDDMIDDDNDTTDDDSVDDDDTSPDDDTIDDDTSPDDDTSDDDDDEIGAAIVVGGSEEYGPVAWIRSAKGWSVLAIPGAPGSYPLNDVAASGSGTAFLVGGYGQTAGVYEYKDDALNDRSFACYSCWQFGVALSATAPAAGAGCFAHSGFTASRIWIDDGVTFNAAPVTEPNAYGMCVARDVCWIDDNEAVAVGRDYYSGQGILWSGNETGFAPEDPPLLLGQWELTAVAACPDGDAYAVGVNTTQTQGLVLRRDAGNWTKETLPNVSADWDLRGIACADGHVFAVGYDKTNGRGVLLKKDDGWSRITLPLADGDWGLEGVAIDSAGNGLLVGFDAQDAQALIFRRSADEWIQEAAPTAEANQPLLGVALLD